MKRPSQQRRKPRPSSVYALVVFCLVLSGSVTTAQAAPLPDWSVDLHAHLFMKQGMGWLFRGSFDGPIAATSWRNRLSSKVNRAALDASGNGIVVVSLFAHPLEGLDVRASIRRQVALTEQLAASHPGWALARDAGQARRLIAAGKKVLVLSLEGAAGVLESEEDLAEFIDELGIRIVTPLHLVDDRYGGSARLNGYQLFGNPLALADQLLDPTCGEHDVPINPRGLSSAGRQLVLDLIKRGVWIDLAHASDVALAQLWELIEAAGQPPLFTHTTMRRYRATERALSDSMLRKLGAAGGIVGLLPSEDAFETIRVAKRFCPEGCSQEACGRGVSAFAQMYTDVVAVLGPAAVMLGADFNGGMRHLAPSCSTGSSLDKPAGLLHMGQIGELWAATRRLGAPVPALRQQLERFLQAWAKVRPVSLPTSNGAKALPSHRTAVAGPGVTLDLMLGATSNAPAFDSDCCALPGLLVGLDFAVLKDIANKLPVEPMFLLAPLAAQASVVFDEPARLVHFEAHVAPAGVEASDGDNRVFGQLLRLGVERHEPIDEALRLELSAIAGGARLTPGLVRSAGRYNTYLQLQLELIGYKSIEHLSERLTRRGFRVGLADLELGVSLYPDPALPWTLFAAAGADLMLGPDEADELATASDIVLRTGLHARLCTELTAFALGRWRGAHEGGFQRAWHDDLSFAGGLRLTLF